MKHKDYEPIKFEIFQSDMEKIMYELDNIIENFGSSKNLLKIKEDLQHKIDCHKERGEWI